MTDIQWLIGGEAGYGIMTTGVMMAKIFTRIGLSVFDYVEYPSLVRGGHNAYYVRASDQEIFSQKKEVDILVALNRETIDRHKSEISNDGSIIYDPNVTDIKKEEFSKDVKLIPVPLLEITKQVGADKLMINTVSVGASLALFYSDFALLGKILRDAFDKKGEEIVAENVNTSKAGFDYVKKNFSGKIETDIAKKNQEKILLSGAEAVCLGSIKAGLKFAAIYPMTPINAILTMLTEEALKYNIVVKEPEDEISGINMAIGASLAGVRSMVATSGGGFALMTEAVGLSAQAEIPLVIVEGQRPGPSTGMPTWTDQGDLRFVLHASQGDFPKIVLSPGDHFEAFAQMMQAFNLADKYQIPVIVLVDKYLMEGHATVNKSQISNLKFQLERGKILSDQQASQLADFKRYELTSDGVSPRTFPGQKGGIFLSDSYEHNEKGLYDEDPQNRIKMMDKRFKKVENIISQIPHSNFFGVKEAPLTILAFGSTKMPVLQAISDLNKEGVNVNFLHILSLCPFPSEVVSESINNAKKTLVIEGNKTGQFEGLVREKTGLSIDNNFRKYDGRPFYPEEIVAKVKSLL